jgi:hypothetical protein
MYVAAIHVILAISFCAIIALVGQILVQTRQRESALPHPKRASISARSVRRHNIGGRGTSLALKRTGQAPSIGVATGKESKLLI